uniref:Uncharacterized protein n=1 Tax=Rhizophora mucronata TaxID=61149 RepID=A0A2P2QR05_RHIMU
MHVAAVRGVLSPTSARYFVNMFAPYPQPTPISVVHGLCLMMNCIAVQTSSLSAAVNNRAVVSGEPAHPLGFITTGKNPRTSASHTNDLTFSSMLPWAVPGTSNKVVSNPRSSIKFKFAGQSMERTPPSSVLTQTLWYSNFSTSPPSPLSLPLTRILPQFSLTKCLSSSTSFSFTSSSNSLPWKDMEGQRRSTKRLNGVGLVNRIHSPMSAALGSFFSNREREI